MNEPMPDAPPRPSATEPATPDPVAARAAAAGPAAAGQPAAAQAGTGPSAAAQAGADSSAAVSATAESVAESIAESTAESAAGQTAAGQAVPEEPAAGGPAPLGVVRTPTGHPGTDAALDRLADADHLPVGGHPEVYEDVHRGLRDTLTALDRQPGPPAPSRPHDIRS